MANDTQNALTLTKTRYSLGITFVYGNSKLMAFLFCLVPMIFSLKCVNSSAVTVEFTKPDEDKESKYSYELLFQQTGGNEKSQSVTSTQCGPNTCIAEGLKASTSYRMWMHSYVKENGLRSLPSTAIYVTTLPDSKFLPYNLKPRRWRMMQSLWELTREHLEYALFSTADFRDYLLISVLRPGRNIYMYYFNTWLAVFVAEKGRLALTFS